ncbi:carbon-nitrogen hydrolase family protein [Nocardiopsis sp. MG754419]|uniref:carbon-nitrogen hydrolase family protein n=1 Tax=Nocardiopsis sp. MG754419 TaxID=2259865 RepID=UPI001BA6C27F|nr:carbon-nitrogen hydrolase family protein [Nocardiopsis sp. MG754419]MBR8745281.1 carbon-nitrogen hydrolase [Nocardiopsis sp. MG754419]
MPAPLRVALDQGTGRSGDTVAALTRLRTLAGAAAADGATLLVTPEMSLTGYNIGDRVRELAEPADGPLFEAVARIATDTGVSVVYGFPELAEERVYNAVRFVDATGTSRALYRKTHLFGDLDRNLFSPGDELIVQADVGLHRLGFLICYDVEFPEVVRAHAMAGTTFLIVPTALMGPTTSIATLLAPARALENQIHLAYVNRCDSEGDLDYVGLSTLVGPDGTELLRAGSTEALLVGDVDPITTEAARAESSYLDDRRADLYDR